MLNTVAIMGRLTYEPELRSTSSGTSVMLFCVAIDRKYQKQGEERQADFVDCVAWKQTAEFIHKYFSKGEMIAVEGSIQTRNYTDKNNNKRKAVEVLVNNVSFCGSKTEGGNNNSFQPPSSYSTAENSDFEEIVDDDDDLPF